jgi:hypothetical protein
MKQLLKANPTPPAWDPEALWTKALRYAECMMGDDIADWQRGLWSSLALEFLARAALANVSPALLADVSQKNSENLLHALGFEPAGSSLKPRSIEITEVLRRLTSLFSDTVTKELEVFCASHIGKRNSELHSGETPFDGVDPASWQPEFYKVVWVFLKTMGLSLTDFVSKEEAEVAEKMIEAAADERARAVLSEVAAHKRVWEGKSQEEQEELKAAADVWATRHQGHRVTCPACGSRALVQGEHVSAPQTKLEGDKIVESQEYLPSHFECTACGLKVIGLSRLIVIDLAQRFKHTEYYDASDYYFPDDKWAYFDEDNNEPF